MRRHELLRVRRRIALEMRGWAQRRCKAPHEAETRRQPSKSRGCVKEQTQTRQSRLWRWLRRVPCGWRRRGALQQQLLQKGFASRAYWECCLEQTARRFCGRRALIPRSHTRSSNKRRQQQRRRRQAAASSRREHRISLLPLKHNFQQCSTTGYTEVKQRLPPQGLRATPHQPRVAPCPASKRRQPLQWLNCDRD